VGALWARARACHHRGRPALIAFAERHAARAEELAADPELPARIRHLR
jgi:hypothetical protein